MENEGGGDGGGDESPQVAAPFSTAVSTRGESEACSCLSMQRRHCLSTSLWAGSHRSSNALNRQRRGSQFIDFMLRLEF